MSATPPAAELIKSFAGQLLHPHDEGYDEARKLHNGLIDKRPGLIARCRGLADVADAVKIARGRGLELAVRGGGHNVAGRASIDHGAMIDLSLMKGINGDAKAKTARAEGGVLWKEFNRETQLHGLATTGGVVASTGIAGLTLGGGFGWLTPKYALALDNLRSADVVLADGRVVTANAHENPDLFWAIRGGGGNFGIVTSFEYNLHQVGPMITGGLVAHPVQKASDVLKFFRETCAKLTDDQMLVAGLLTAPDGSGAKLVGMLTCHSGSLAAGEAAVQPIKAFGPPVMDAMGPLPYVVQNSLLDEAFPKGALNYWKAQFLTDLSDDAIRTILEAFAACPSPLSQIVIEDFHGAASRVGISDTACTLRHNGFNVVIISQWTDPKDTARGKAWARETYDALKPYFGKTRYLNYLEEDATDTAETIYGPNYSRLREIKRKYDPENVFRANVNIRP